MHFIINSNPLLKKVLLIHFVLLSIFSSTCFAQVKKADKIPLESNAIRFFFVGDWGRNGEHNQQEVADQMGKTGETFDPKFIISAGDNFYCCGVASTEDPQWKYSFEDVYRAHSLNIPWFPVLGNHDYLGNPQAQIDYSKISRRWRMPARYYTVNMKDVIIIFLDTNPFVKKHYKKQGEYADVARQDTLRQLQWLDSTLVNSKEKWKIVVGHHPVYSTGSKHGSTPELIQTLKPILEKHHVPLYLAGHDHDLQFQKPANSSVNYLISGSGSEVRPNTPDPAMTKYAAAVAGFMAISILDNKLTVYFIDKKGNVIYQTEILQD